MKTEEMINKIFDISKDVAKIISPKIESTESLIHWNGFTTALVRFENTYNRNSTLATELCENALLHLEESKAELYDVAEEISPKIKSLLEELKALTENLHASLSSPCNEKTNLGPGKTSRF